MTTRTHLAALLAAATLAAGTLGAPLAHAQPEETGSLMLVLDASGSMRELDGSGTTRIASAQRALTSVVESLPADASVGMRVFGAEITGDPMPTEACQDTQRVVDIGTDNRAELLSAISAYEPFGWTPIPEALRQAAADLGPEGTRHIILVSDGESTCDPDPCEIAAEIAAQGIGLTIDVVGLNVDDATREQLSCIAETGGGEYVDANNADELIAALDQSTKRAVRPFEYDGTPIQGSPYLGDAPKITPGVWRDTLGPGGSETATRYYRVERTMKNSTLQAATLGFLSRTHQDRIEIRFVDINGDTCGLNQAKVSTGSRIVAGAVGTYTGSETPLCQDAAELWVKVERGNSKAPDDLPIQLWVREFPPTVEGYSPAEPAVTFVGDMVPATTPVEVEPGTSISTAPLLSPGKSVTASILPNEIHAYRVPVGWGQAARGTIERRERLDGPGGGFLRIQSIHPSGHSDSGPGLLHARWSGASSAQTLPIWYRSNQGANSAGDAIFLVYWEAEPGSTQDAVDYLMTAEVAGELQEPPEYRVEPIGAPEATDDPSPEPTQTTTAPSPSPEPTVQETATQTANPQPEPETTHADDGETNSLVMPLAIAGGVLLLGGGTAVALIRRRR